MSRTIRSIRDDHRNELKTWHGRGKNSKGKKHHSPGNRCAWCLRQISELERDRKTTFKYPKQNINREI